MLNFLDPVHKYGTQETLINLHAFTSDTLSENLAVVEGTTRKELYETIPKSLSRWNDSLDHPDSAFSTIKAIALGAVIAAFLLPVPLAIAGFTGGEVGIAIVASSEFAVIMTGALVAYLVTNYFHNKFMNRQLSEKEIADTKNKIKRDLQKRIRNDTQIIFYRLIALKQTDLTTVSPQLQNQFESMYLLERFRGIAEPFKDNIAFQKFLRAKNYTNL